jgi:hypothetical protein
VADHAAIPEIDHYELDGIPLFHLPMAGETILTLAFRVGRADEPPIRGGMTHLAEHLILTSISDALDHSNGTTEPYRVTFTKRGNPAEVTRFLKDVCAAIDRPPMHRLYEEARVLRTESSTRGGLSIPLQLAVYRTGYQGIGLFVLRELFLGALDEATLQAWMAENLVAGNAAIWIAGQLPDDLLVDLPPGPRRPMPPIAWVPGLQTPTFVVEDIPGIGASFVVERSIASGTAIRTLERRLRQALRVNRGMAYDVASDNLHLGHDRILASIWATCLPENVSEVERIVLETIDDMAARGPTEEDIEEQYDRMVRDLSDPVSIPSRLDARTTDALMGHPSRSTAAMLDAYWRLRPDEVAEAFRKARETMLLLIPSTGFRPQRPMHAYPSVTTSPPGRGRSFEQATTRGKTPWSRTPAARLTVGDAGVSVDSPDGIRIIGVRWADCVAVVQGAGARSVLALDGTTLSIIEQDWRGGRDAVGLIDRFAPRELMVPAIP